MKKLSTIKRLLVGALALTMLAGSIAGCGGGDKKGAAKPAAAQTVKINGAMFFLLIKVLMNRKN